MEGHRTIRWGTVCAGLVILAMVRGAASRPAGQRASSKGASSSAVGVWELQTPKGVFTLLLNDGGSGEFNGSPIQWKLNQKVLMITEQDGTTTMYNVSVSATALTLSGANLQAPMTFKRSGSSASPGGNSEQPGSEPAGGLGVVAGGAKSSGIVGTWAVQNPNGTFTLILNADGSGRFNKDNIQWEFNEGVLTLRWENGNSFMYNATLTATSLKVAGGNLRAPITFERQGSEEVSGGLGAVTSGAAPLGKSTPAASSGPIGTWETRGGSGPVTMELRPDGSGIMAGENIHWQYNQGVLSIAREGGDVHMYNAKLTPTTITLSTAQMKQPSVFRRVGGATRSAGMASARASSASGPGGNWEVPGPKGTIHLVLKPDGSGEFGGGPIHWTFNQNVLSLTGPNGQTIMYNASLSGSSMVLSGGGLDSPVHFRRAGSAPEGGPNEGEAESNSGEGGLVGSWKGNNGILKLNADGTAIYNGVNLRYTAESGVLTLIGNDGTIPIQYTLNGDTLSVTIQGQRGSLTRFRGGSRGMMAGGTSGSTPGELAGKWCYVSVSNTGQVSGSSDSCFTLYPNGTYTYSGESSNSNQYGGTASQSSDSGTWSINGSTLTANSRSQGIVTYTLEKRNHPKTNDPMLCLDGKCFVTYGPKPPWSY